MKIVKPLLIGACALACAATYAASDASLPHETVQGWVTYVSGGVGKDESDAMKEAENRYPLALEFSEHASPKAEYLADVNLTIEDKAGNRVLETSSVGPYVLANVPDGKYTIKAEENGKTQVRHVTIASGKPERIAMVW